MYDPIMRVLTVLEILQSREHVTGSELAARLEVSSRTVQRYIARLLDLCIPVEAVRGAGGFYRLKPGFRLPPLMFTDEEAFALTLGLRALRQLGLSAFAPATEGAAAKLGRVLPSTLRDNVSMAEDVVALEPGPWVISTRAEVLIRVAMAIRAHRRLVFDYQSHEGISSRRQLEPYGVVHMDGRWYMADLPRTARDRAVFYGYTAVVNAEREHEERHQAFLRELTSKFLERPTLDFPTAPEMTRNFNPETLVPFPPHGTYYPSGTFAANWGKLQVDSGGALVAPENRSLRVPAPTDPEARPIRGAGWTLQIAPGWTIRPSGTPGSFKLVPAPQ